MIPILLVMFGLGLLSCDAYRYGLREGNEQGPVCQDPASLPPLDPRLEASTNKVLVVPFSFKKHVAGFIKEMIEGLEDKGWLLVDSETQVLTSDVLNDIQNATGVKTKPDIVLFFIIRDKTLDLWGDLSHFSFSKILVVEDIHEEHDILPARRLESTADAFFVRYPEAFKKAMITSQARCFPWRHAASKPFIQAKQPEQKQPQALLSGMTYVEFYPLRASAQNLYWHTRLIAKYNHPGYGIVDPLLEQTLFADSIASYQIAIAGLGYGTRLFGSYLIAKHFEIPATGTVMLTDELAVPELADLGFVENKHFITANPYNLEDKIQYWLAPNQAETLKRIAKNGQELVLKRHTNEKRIQELHEMAIRVHQMKRTYAESGHN